VHTRRSAHARAHRYRWAGIDGRSIEAKRERARRRASGARPPHCTCLHRCAHARVRDEAALRRRPAHARRSAHALARRQRRSGNERGGGPEPPVWTPWQPAHATVGDSREADTPQSAHRHTSIHSRVSCARQTRRALCWVPSTMRGVWLVGAGSRLNGLAYMAFIELLSVASDWLSVGPPVQARCTAPAGTCLHVVLTHAFESRRRSDVALRMHAGQHMHVCTGIDGRSIEAKRERAGRCASRASPPHCTCLTHAFETRRRSAVALRIPARQQTHLRTGTDGRSVEAKRERAGRRASRARAPHCTCLHR
jgi:hypothetical protein